MRKLLRALECHWFSVVPATRPALLRIVIGAYALHYIWLRRAMLTKMIETGDPKLYQPVGLARFHPRPLPVPVVKTGMAAMMAANVGFILGWRYRVTGPLYSSLFCWFMSYRNSWSMIYHSNNVLVFHLLILGMTPAADVLSLDASPGVPAGRGGPNLFGSPQSRDVAGDWQYGWPIRLMNVLTMAPYFLAGVAKLKGPSGLGWATGDQLRRQIAVDAIRKELLGKPASPAAYRLYHREELFRLLAVGSLVIETAAPLFLVNRRLARVWAVNAWALHWGILALMNITFRYQLSGIMYLSFFEIEKLLDLIDGRRRDQ